MSPVNQADCRHPRLALRYALAILCTVILLLIFAAPLFFAPRIYLVLALIIGWFIFLLWVLAEIFYAFMVDNAVLVSELNYPRINQLAEEVREALGLNRPISIFVYEQGDFNALLVRMFRRRAIFLQSEVLEAGVSDDEVRWLVGRFVGYLRVYQDSGVIGWLVRVTERSGLFTLLVYPYVRAMVYTGDRLGLAAIGGDVSAAISVMQKIMVGRQLGYSVNPLGIIDQRRKTKGSIFAFLARISSPFPSNTARYVDLICFARQRFPEAYQRFEASTPGLPADLNQLSGERTSGASVFKAIAAYVGVVVAMALTWGGAALFMSALSPAYDSSSGLDTPVEDLTTFNTTDDMMVDANATVYDEAAAMDAANAVENVAAAPGYYSFCIINYSSYDITYQVRYNDVDEWEYFTVSANATQPMPSYRSEAPRIRFNSSLGDSAKYTTYNLNSSYVSSLSECSDPKYYFRVRDSGVELTTD